MGKIHWNPRIQFWQVGWWEVYLWKKRETKRLNLTGNTTEKFSQRIKDRVHSDKRTRKKLWKKFTLTIKPATKIVDRTKKKKRSKNQSLVINCLFGNLNEHNLFLVLVLKTFYVIFHFMGKIFNWKNKSKIEFSGLFNRSHFLLEWSLAYLSFKWLRHFTIISISSVSVNRIAFRSKICTH